MEKVEHCQDGLQWGTVCEKCDENFPVFSGDISRFRFVLQNFQNNSSSSNCLQPDRLLLPVKNERFLRFAPHTAWFSPRIKSPCRHLLLILHDFDKGLKIYFLYFLLHFQAQSLASVLGTATDSGLLPGQQEHWKDEQNPRAISSTVLLLEYIGTVTFSCFL